MISTNTNLTHRAGHYPEFQDETSGMANLNAKDRAQRFRDNLNWFDGLMDGIFWGMIIGALLVATVFLIANH